MKKTVNFTGRKKILRSEVEISTINRNEAISFDAKFRFEAEKYSKSAKVYVEPYYKYSFMRFDFGTVGNIETPKNRELIDIPNEDNIQFRVKIVDETEGNGKIFAHATNLKPNNKEYVGKDAILPINFVDLDQEVWKVSFEAEKPFLEINKKIKDGKEFVRKNPLIHSLILPAALRIIISRIINDEEEYDEDGDLWQNKWIRFVKQNLFVSREVPEANDEERIKEEWLDEVVSSFARKFYLFDKFITEFK